MRRTLADGIELDDDPDRIDIDAVYAYLSGESYWAGSRTREQVARTLQTSSRVIGVYDDARQIGFARVVSDEVTIAYLADVYVLSEYRGRGLGVELVGEAVQGGPHAALRWWLATDDAHELYRRFGFTEPDHTALVRPRPHLT